MKKLVKKLVIVNLLCYFSYFIYSIVYYQFNGEIKNWLVIVAFIPYFLVIYSAFIITFNDNKKKMKGFKIIGAFDLLVRISVMFTNFHTTILSKESLKFKILIVSMVILFVVNILLEIYMYIKAYSVKEQRDEESLKWYDISFQDRVNYGIMLKSFQKCFGHMTILMVVITVILGINENSKVYFIVVATILCLILLKIFFSQNYKALKLFYNDENVFKRMYFKETIIVLSSLIIGISFAIVRLIGYGNSDIIKFIALVIQMIVLYPKFKNNSKRARNFMVIKRARKTL